MKARVIQLKMINRFTAYSDNIKLGDRLLELKKYSLAIEAFEEAADYATNKEDGINALIKMGISERLEGRYCDAIQTFELAIKKAYFINDKYSYRVAIIKRQMGIILMTMPSDDHNYETLDKAIKYFEESFCILLNTSYDVQAAISQELLGVALSLKGKSFRKDAVAMIEEAGKKISQSDNSNYIDELDNLIWLGMISVKYRYVYFFRIIRLATYAYPDNYVKVFETIFGIIRGNWIIKKFQDSSE